MKTTRIGAAAVAVAVVATLLGREVWARSRQPEPAFDESALNRDLDLAAGAGVSLAPMGGEPLVVAAELAPPGEKRETKAPRAASKPRRRATPQRAPEPEPQPVEAPAVAEDPQGTEVAEVAMAGESEAAGDLAEAPAPAPMPRPTPIPVSYPAGGGDGGYGTAGRGGGIGGAIGVILRGGAVGDDHCIPNGGSRGGRRSGRTIRVIGGRGGERMSGMDIGSVLNGAGRDRPSRGRVIRRR